MASSAHLVFLIFSLSQQTDYPSEKPSEMPSVFPSKAPTSSPTSRELNAASAFLSGMAAKSTPSPSYSSDAPSSQPSLSPKTICSTHPRYIALLTALTNSSSPDKLLDHDSGPGAAFAWIAKDDLAQVDPCTYPTLKQRHALATLYYSTEEYGFVDNSTWLSNETECKWQGVFCDEGLVTFLYLSKWIGTIVSMLECIKTS